MFNLGGNERWKSKFIIPEHDSALQSHFHHRDKFRGERPVLDEQEKEQIMRVLMESLGMRVTAEFQLYHKYEDLAVIGVVDRVDPYSRTFTVEGEQFQIADIIGAVAKSQSFEEIPW